MKWPLPLLLATSLLSSAHAAEYRFDAVHSQVQFHVWHLGFSRSEGEFHDLQGSFDFDAEHWDRSRCDVQIGVASIDLDDAAWNKKLLEADWFDVQAHPQMRFRCTGVEPLGESKARISGDLTLRGITRPVVLETTFNRAATHKYSLQYVAGFSATTTIKRSVFGMEKLLPEVGDEIEIRLEIEGIREGKARDRKK